MFKAAIVSTFLATAYTVSAHAPADPMAAFYGNTWEVTEPDGTRQILIEPSGRFTIELPGGKVFEGAWTRDGQRVCFQVAKDRACFTDIVGRSVDKVWTGREEGHAEDYRAVIRTGRKSSAAPQN